jgi:hypothetical protein
MVLASGPRKVEIWTYEEGTGNEHDNAVLAGWLGIEGGNLVLDLLEGKSLHSIIESVLKRLVASRKM